MASVILFCLIVLYDDLVADELVIQKVIIILYALGRRGWLDPWGNRMYQRLGGKKRTVIYETHYVVYHTEAETSQSQMIIRNPIPLEAYLQAYATTDPSAYPTGYSPMYPPMYAQPHPAQQPPEYQQEQKYY
ncbi:hypothetical protein BGW37DRAFT_481395 [Umbelopsis sp. PMI_123]|nr:hypothetical protein BGW37DRAFT_481395 [Umbelopsis sp. PMI_123]